MLVIKRDGRAVNYDRSKIILAIQKANSEVEPCEKISDEKIEDIVGPWSHITPTITSRW